jgi:hypothetical protein
MGRKWPSAVLPCWPALRSIAAGPIVVKGRPILLEIGQEPRQRRRLRGRDTRRPRLVASSMRFVSPVKAPSGFARHVSTKIDFGVIHTRKVAGPTIGRAAPPLPVVSALSKPLTTRFVEQAPEATRLECRATRRVERSWGLLVRNARNSTRSPRPVAEIAVAPCGAEAWHRGHTQSPAELEALGDLEDLVERAVAPAHPLRHVRPQPHAGEDRLDRVARAEVDTRPRRRVVRHRTTSG